ncbi:hypothetical protein D3C81_1687910 [compost metagenome]
MIQSGESGLWLVAGHGQFGCQGAGENLLGRLHLRKRYLLENARCLHVVLLPVSLVGGTQAQGTRFQWILAGGGLFEQLLDAGVRGARKFAKARRGTGTRRQQGDEAEGGEQPQASNHVNVLILDQINGQLYPSTGRGAMLPARKHSYCSCKCYRAGVVAGCTMVV